MSGVDFRAIRILLKFYDAEKLLAIKTNQHLLKPMLRLNLSSEVHNPHFFHYSAFTATNCARLVIILTDKLYHYSDVIVGSIASQITNLKIVYSIVYADADQRKHQSSASLAFVRGIHRGRWIPRTKGQ